MYGTHTVCMVLPPSSSLREEDTVMMKTPERPIQSKVISGMISGQNKRANYLDSRT